MSKRSTSVPTEKLWKLYQELGSVWRVAEAVGLCGQSVHERLVKGGYKLKGAYYTPDEDARIKEYYLTTPAGSFDLQALADELGRPKTNMCRRARQLGLTNQRRKMSDSHRAKVARNSKAWLASNPHPRGALGMKHSPETLKKLSKASMRAWANMTPKQLAARNLKALKTRRERGTLIQPRHKASWKQGWHTVGGKRCYFRSKWEVNYARYLEWLKGLGEISEWEYEPDTFWFEAIKRGTRCYTPDFKVTEANGKVAYHEIKGWMDDRSKTKLKRMAKYHPEVQLVLVDSSAYKKLARQVKNLVPDWE